MYAELPEVVDDLRALILHAQRLDVGPRELGAVVLKEFSAMYQRLNPELAGAFSRLGDEWL